MYQNGKGVTKDEAEAVKWYRKAAEQGNSFAQYNLAKAYDSAYYGNRGTVNDIKEAVKWYRKAAEQGDADAQYELAKNIKLGIGTQEDEVESLKWYTKAAESGNAIAQIQLALKCFSENNFVEARKWFLMAADQGSIIAQLHIAWMYKDGRGGEQDYQEARKWFQKSAESGNAEAQCQLGRLYYNGRGVEKDFYTAVNWFKKSVEQGNVEAHYFLGMMYSNGEGVPKNYQEAVKLLQKAADQGHAQSQMGLSQEYFREGTTADTVKALAWATLAAAEDEKAKEIRDDIEKLLKPNEIAQAQQLAAKLKSDIEKRQKQKLGLNEGFETSKQLAKAYIPLSVLTPTKLAFSSNDIAIIIGIEKYRSVPPTEYAAADAATVRDYMKALGIPERNIEFLTDDRATLSDIRKVIETKLPNMVKANSRVIVYYAGHGAPGKARGESYLVPYDGDPSFLADTAYPLSRLYDRLSRLNAKEVLVILDSCFSGAGGRSVLAKNTRPLVMVKDTPPPASKKMIVMTSSRGSQITTSLSEVGHGAFTYFFLRALQEGNRDIGEVYAYLNPRVTEEAKRQNVDQTPTISPTADKLKGRFLFAR